MRLLRRGNCEGYGIVMSTWCMNAHIISEENEAPGLIEGGPMLNSLAKGLEGYFGIVCKMYNRLLV